MFGQGNCNNGPYMQAGTHRVHVDGVFQFAPHRHLHDHHDDEVEGGGRYPPTQAALGLFDS